MITDQRRCCQLLLVHFELYVPKLAQVYLAGPLKIYFVVQVVLDFADFHGEIHDFSVEGITPKSGSE